MDSAKLDKHWREALKDRNRFSLNWYRNHPITRELRKSQVLWGKVIEFGCGIGTRAYLVRIYQHFLVLHDYSVLGVDGSAFAIDYAKKHWEMARLRFKQDDLLDLDIPDRRFDNGYMLATIEHIEDTERLLGECRRVLQSWGKLFVSVTENDYHGDPSHMHTFDLVSLQEALAASGFSVQGAYVKDHIVYATGRVCSS